MPRDDATRIAQLEAEVAGLSLDVALRELEIQLLLERLAELAGLSPAELSRQHHAALLESLTEVEDRDPGLAARLADRVRRRLQWD